MNPCKNRHEIHFHPTGRLLVNRDRIVSIVGMDFRHGNALPYRLPFRYDAGFGKGLERRRDDRAVHRGHVFLCGTRRNHRIRSYSPVPDRL